MSTNKLVTKSFKWEENELPQLFALIKFEEDSASFSDAMRDFLKKLILDKNAPLSSEPEDSDPEQYNKPLPPQNPFTQPPTNPFIKLDENACPYRTLVHDGKGKYYILCAEVDKIPVEALPLPKNQNLSQQH